MPGVIDLHSKVISRNGCPRNLFKVEPDIRSKEVFSTLVHLGGKNALAMGVLRDRFRVREVGRKGKEEGLAERHRHGLTAEP